MANTFIDGLSAFQKKDNAPSFIIADVVLNLAKLNDYYENNRELFKEMTIRLQLKTSKEGKPYFAVNDFVPDPSFRGSNNHSAPSTPPVPTPPDDLPF